MVQRGHEAKWNQSPTISSTNSQGKRGSLCKLYKLQLEKQLCSSNYRYLILSWDSVLTWWRKFGTSLASITSCKIMMPCWYIVYLMGTRFKTRASWEDNKDKTEIHWEREWKEMMDRAYKIPVPEDNGSLPRHLVIAVPKKRDIISKLET